MARPRLVPILAAAALAVPLALVVAPEEAEATHDRYTMMETIDYSGTQWGSRFIICQQPDGPLDFAVSHRIVNKTGPAKVRGATFYSTRAGDNSHDIGDWFGHAEGVVVEW